MTLSLIDQYQQAVTMPDFRHKVSAAAFDEARAQLGKPPLIDPTQESQRKSLIAGIFHSVDYATDLFAWAVVSDPAMNTVDDLTDANIKTCVASTFNPVAQQFPVH